MLELIVLPRAFSYSATTLRKAASSSGTKPCVHHTVAVLAAALAIWGRARVPAATNPNDPRSTERLLTTPIPFPPVSAPRDPFARPPDRNPCMPSLERARRAQLLDCSPPHKWRGPVVRADF